MDKESNRIICTWDSGTDCIGCGNYGKLHCRWDRDILMTFYAIALPPLIAAIFGIILVNYLIGAWWSLAVYVIFLFVFFVLYEIRILCSHCPYYAEESIILHCLANHGMPKLWRYHPEPMNGFERISLIVCFLIIFFLFPLAVQGYGMWFITVHYARDGSVALLGLTGIALITILSGLAFFIVLRHFYCSRCVNFSCPLNSVPREVVDEFLRRNPVMREAWERCGYRL
jgi:hypothetical protein